MNIIDRFLAESPYTDATKTLYRINLKYWFDWIQVSQLNHDDLAPEHVQQFLESRVWSLSSRRIFACVVKAFYKWQNPTHPITRIHVRKPPVRPRPFYYKDQIDTILDAMGDAPIDVRNKSLIALAFDTGLRADEICRLELRDVRLDEMRLFVMVKGQRYEEAVFSKLTATLIQDWLRIRAYASLPNTKTLFCSLGGHKSGDSLTRHGLRAIFYVITQEAGLERGSPHRFRHSCANEMLRKGASTIHIQMGLRLKDLSQVPRYTQGRNLQQLRRYLPMASG